MQEEEHRAIVLGATGAVGAALVRELLASPRFAQVVVVARRAVDMFAQARGIEKLVAHRISMEDLERETLSAAKGCDVAFCTMGVGQPRKVTKEELWRVDVDNANAFARACRMAGVRHISLLSSAEASMRSRNHYLHVKGSAEEALRTLRFERTSFFRPGLLVTKEIRYGTQDRLTQIGFPLVSWMLPRRWHQIPVEELAAAMRANAERPAREAVEVLHYDEFRTLLTA